MALHKRARRISRALQQVVIDAFVWLCLRRSMSRFAWLLTDSRVCRMAHACIVEVGRIFCSYIGDSCIIMSRCKLRHPRRHPLFPSAFYEMRFRW